MVFEGPFQAKPFCDFPAFFCAIWPPEHENKKPSQLFTWLALHRLVTSPKGKRTMPHVSIYRYILPFNIRIYPNVSISTQAPVFSAYPSQLGSSLGARNPPQKGKQREPEQHTQFRRLGGQEVGCLASQAGSLALLPLSLLPTHASWQHAAMEKPPSWERAYKHAFSLKNVTVK